MTNWPVPRLALALPVLLFLGLGGCGADPVVPESLCRGVPGRWFSDATGKTALTDKVNAAVGAHLPLDDRGLHLSCNVFAGDKVVAWFDAEVTIDPSEVNGLRRWLEGSHGRWDFEVGGGRGRVRESSKDSLTGLEASWTCGNTTLTVGVKQFADRGKKMELTKQLAERIAGTTGCAS